jgi:predicted ester cyclase
MGQRAWVAGSNFARLLPFANEVSHQLHRLPIATVDVVGECGQNWTEDGHATLDLPDERTELFVSAEVDGCSVDDEMETSQRGSLAGCGTFQASEVFVGAAVEGFGDQVLLAVEELVDGRGRVSGQLGDPAQRAVAQTVLAEDSLGGIEDVGCARGAPGRAAPAAWVVAWRIGHDHTVAKLGLDLWIFVYQSERVSTNDDAEVNLVRHAVSALNGGDIEGYLSGFAPDCLRWVGGLGLSLTVPDIRENLRQLFAAFDRLHLDEDLLFGGGGHVCARWTLRGVHTGEYGGIAPTHRTIAVDTCEIYTFTGGKVTECYVYGETMNMFNQLSGEST